MGREAAEGMGMSERAIVMSAKLYGIRRDLQTLHGDKYQTTVALFMRVLRAKSKETGTSILDTAVVLAEEAKADPGMASLWFLAAAVEAIENEDLESLVNA